MTRRSRGHAPVSGTFQRTEQKLDADGPIAPQIPAFCQPFPAKEPSQGVIAVSRPDQQTLISVRNLLACHGVSSVKEGLGRPQNRFGSSPLSNGT
ncbi:hypothetical protein V1289_002225 [Bradyrhizobium sp. AZCC 2289]